MDKQQMAIICTGISIGALLIGYVLGNMVINVNYYNLAEQAAKEKYEMNCLEEQPFLLSSCWDGCYNAEQINDISNFRLTNRTKPSKFYTLCADACVMESNKYYGVT